MFYAMGSWHFPSRTSACNETVLEEKLPLVELGRDNVAAIPRTKLY